MERGKLHLDLKGWEGEFCSATITLQPPTANSKQEGNREKFLLEILDKEFISGEEERQE